MRHQRICVLYALVMLFLSACHWEKTQLHNSQAVNESGWKQADTLVFRPDTLPPGHYQLSAEVRYTDRYPYQDLWLLVEHNTVDSSRFVTDTVVCHLISEDGIFRGDGVSGLFQLQVPVGELIVPYARKDVLLTVRHGMADEALRGVSDVGLRLERVE